MFVSELSESGGREGRAGINVWRGREMGPVGLEMGPEGPVCQKVGGERTGSRLSFKDTLPMGEEEEDLVFLCVRAEMETEPGSHVMRAVAVPFAKKA